MTSNEARNQLKEILANQKTVSVSKLKKLIDGLEAEHEKEIKREKRDIQNLISKNNRQKKALKRLEELYELQKRKSETS